MQEAIDELDVDEHPDASLPHESGWSLGAFGSGLLAWGNVEASELRDMKGVPRSHRLATVVGPLQGGAYHA